MEFFKHNTQIDFMSQQKMAAIISTLLFALSILALAVYGLNWGLDFTGGTQIQMSFPQQVDLNQVRDKLLMGGFKEAEVKNYGTSRDILVTIAAKESSDSNESSSENVTSNKSSISVTNLHANENSSVKESPDSKDNILKKIHSLLPDAKIQQVEYIGPQVGQELATKGALAIFVALLGTMIYIGLRFEFRFAVGSTVALIHDPVLILGIFAFFGIEFNLIALAAILTVIGYSLNDTIVIFDRVRENFRKLRKSSALEVINQSINQTLSRTIMTSVLTLLVVLALFFLGGTMLHGFSVALIIGIIVGTYSSIYVAGSLALALGLTRQHLLPVTKELLDDRP